MFVFIPTMQVPRQCAAGVASTNCTATAQRRRSRAGVYPTTTVFLFLNSDHLAREVYEPFTRTLASLVDWPFFGATHPHFECHIAHEEPLDETGILTAQQDKRKEFARMEFGCQYEFFFFVHPASNDLSSSCRMHFYYYYIHLRRPTRALSNLHS